MFPVEVSCPKCGASLSDSNNPIEGFPAVHLLVNHAGIPGELWISSLYGSYRGKLSIDIPKGSEVDLICPHCDKVLSDGPECSSCGADTAILEMARGGSVRFCSRFGCRKHSIAFGDLGSVVVASIMNRYIVSVYVSDSILFAAETLINYEISGLPVLNDDESLAGLISEERIFEVVYPEVLENSEPQTKLSTMEDWKNTSCLEIIHEDSITIEPDMSLIEAGAIMLKHHLNLLMVVKDNVLVGVLSRGDLFRALLREQIG